MTDAERRDVFDTRCGHWHPAHVSLDEHGFPVTRFLEHCTDAKQLGPAAIDAALEAEREYHVNAIAHEAAAEINAAWDAGEDWGRIERITDEALSMNDPKDT